MKTSYVTKFLSAGMESQHIFKCQGTFVGHEVWKCVCMHMQQCLPLLLMKFKFCRDLCGHYAHMVSSCLVPQLTTLLRYLFHLQMHFNSPYCYFVQVWDLSATYEGPQTLTGHTGIVLALQCNG